MYICCMILLMIFAVVGLCSLISSLIDGLYRGKNNMLIILRDLEADSAEARIRRAARLCRSSKGSSLLCICRENDPACDIARLMQKDYPFMEIREVGAFEANNDPPES